MRRGRCSVRQSFRFGYSNRRSCRSERNHSGVIRARSVSSTAIRILSPMLAAKLFLRLHECCIPGNVEPGENPRALLSEAGATAGICPFPGSICVSQLPPSRGDPNRRILSPTLPSKSGQGPVQSDVGLRCSGGLTIRSNSRSMRAASDRSGSTDSPGVAIFFSGTATPAWAQSCRSASSQISTSHPSGHPRSVQIA
jgi:hypothetical protein